MMTPPAALDASNPVPARRGSHLLLIALMLLTIAVYWPSLSGGFLFDDSIYPQNPAVLVRSLRLGDWVNAALSQAGTNQFRALSMISFAANHYLTGADPWWFKLTNLGIHLLNGLLVFLLTAQLARLRNALRTSDARNPFLRDGSIFAAIVAGLWLLAPINLTDVAYISQRIESLANVFVLLGLFLYVRWRRFHFLTGNSTHGGWVCVTACMLAGLTAKESAALLPLFTACIEYALTGFRNRDGRLSRPVVAMHLLLLVLPLIAGLWWLAHWIAPSYTQLRTFTLEERLLTEARVLVDYLVWTLWPSLRSLTFYHDDIALSHGLLSPPTTLVAIAALAILLMIAGWQRSRRPLFCLGVLWFFAGHAMTATIIPLELVFEHRNYFPSMGILLAAASLVAGMGDGLASRLQWATALFALALFSSVTFLRAQEWSNPLTLAHAEASKRPNSMRAQYDWALNLIMAAGDDHGSPLLDQARHILARIVYRDDSGLAPAQALIFLAGRDGRPVDPGWWKEIVRKLRLEPPSRTDIRALDFLSRCMSRGTCADQPQHMLDVFMAALPASSNNADVMTAYSDFAYRRLNDHGLAIRLAVGAADSRPDVATYRYNLIRILIASGQLNEARRQLTILQSMNRWGSLDRELSELTVLFRRASAAGAATHTGPQATASGTQSSPP